MSDNFLQCINVYKPMLKFDKVPLWWHDQISTLYNTVLAYM